MFFVSTFYQGFRLMANLVCDIKKPPRFRYLRIQASIKIIFSKKIHLDYNTCSSNHLKSENCFIFMTNNDLIALYLFINHNLLHYLILAVFKDQGINAVW